MTRSFDDRVATRERVPVLVGLMGPSGSGKTFSALRLAAGMQTISGGEVFVIDTEARRATHYADRFRFRHIDFGAPFGPLDYLDAIEHCVRKRALAIPAVDLQTGCTVQGLAHRDGRVTGVRYEGPAGPVTMVADLVVDTGGRGSHAPRWLEELGVPRPPETTIGIDFAYASTKYRLREDHGIREGLLGFFGPAPKFPNGAYLGAIEDGMWHVSLAGRFGDDQALGMQDADERLQLLQAQPPWSELPLKSLLDVIQARRAVQHLQNAEFLVAELVVAQRDRILDAPVPAAAELQRLDPQVTPPAQPELAGGRGRRERGTGVGGPRRDGGPAGTGVSGGEGRSRHPRIPVRRIRDGA